MVTFNVKYFPWCLCSCVDTNINDSGSYNKCKSLQKPIISMRPITLLVNCALEVKTHPNLNFPFKLLTAIFCVIATIK